MVKNIKYDKVRPRAKSGAAKSSNSAPKKAKSSLRSEEEEIAALRAQYETADASTVTSFRELPLSKKTLRGLKECGYKVPTDIQKSSIVTALRGNDVLGSALTGSGKTLAFLLPILECLYVNKWTRIDGVGAVVITPTRELAYQIFETLKKVGQFHDFSAGLVIGGKNLKFEKHRMDQCNIIICTPGRLLQHMDENPLFTCDPMKILVLDEADRCLDMGFEAAMNAIIENLPSTRQTLLFSATQTKSLTDLARLSLTDPERVAPDDQQATGLTKSSPDQLKHCFVECNVEDKITMLWSFLKQHKKAKIIVFMSSCKQVKFVYEMFSKLRPGITMLALYGTLSQDRRVNVYNEFCTKANVVLFATDIASRGLDFPEVSWVLQLDCPEDSVAYIHRAGRTARFNAKGDNLLVLLPSEREGMLMELEDRQIKIEEIHIDPKYLFSPRIKMESFLAQKKDLKDTAQRAFIAYIKSVVLMKNKKVFKVEALNLDAFARSFGLVITPRVRFLDRMNKKKKDKKSGSKTEFNFDANGETITTTTVASQEAPKSNGMNKVTKFDSDDDEEGEEEDNLDSDDQEGNVEKVDKKKKKKDSSSEEEDSNSDTDDDDDFMTVKRKDHTIEEEQESDGPEEESILYQPQSRKKLSAKPLTKASLAKKVLKKKIVANKKIVFDEEGEAQGDSAKQFQSELGRQYEEDDDEDEGGGIDIERAKQLLREEDKFDKARFKELVKARKEKKKEKRLAKEKKRKQQQEGADSGEDDDGGEDGSGQEMDDFGSDEDGDGPDLSWLPDPDKIYGPSGSGDEEEEEVFHRPPEKLVEKKCKKNKRKQTEDVDEEQEEVVAVQKVKKAKRQKPNLSEDLSLNEAEAIALKLLGS